jgi:hypothetical protein
VVSVVSFSRRISVSGFQQKSKCRGICCSVGRCTDKNRWILHRRREQLFVHLVGVRFRPRLPQPHSFLRRSISAIYNPVWIFRAEQFPVCIRDVMLLRPWLNWFRRLVGEDTSPPATAQSGSMSILGGVSSSAVFFAGLLGIFLA